MAVRPPRPFSASSASSRSSSACSAGVSSRLRPRPPRRRFLPAARFADRGRGLDRAARLGEDVAAVDVEDADLDELARGVGGVLHLDQAAGDDRRGRRGVREPQREQLDLELVADADRAERRELVLAPDDARAFGVHGGIDEHVDLRADALGELHALVFVPVLRLRRDAGRGRDVHVLSVAGRA